MYRWVSCVTHVSFYKMVSDVLEVYEPYPLNFFSNKKRGPEVRSYFDQNLTNQQILAYIFSGGNTHINSLNTLLFTKLLDQMCLTISSSKQAKEDQDYQWILEINFKQHFNYFLESLQRYAKDKSNAFSVKESLVTEESLSHLKYS